MQLGLDVTVLVEDKKTGIGNYVFSLTQALLHLDKKNKYTLLGITPLKASQYIQNLEFKKNPNVNLRVYKMPSKLFHQVFGIWQTINFPPIEFLTGKIDIFHSFDWYFPPSLKAKKVATIFDITPLTHPEGHTKANISQHKKRLSSIQKKADLITTISQFSKKEIIRALKIPADKIFVAYPGVDKKKFFPIKNKDRIKKVLAKYNLKPGFILFVGSWYPRKNILRLIKAYNFLKKQGKIKQKLILVGRKSNRLGKLPLNKNIVPLGFVEEKDLPFFYNAASVFIYPSLAEGFGIPIIEAMACGCPVVTSNISSMPEAAGKAGFFVNPHQTKEIAKGLIEVLTNRGLTEKMKQLGLIQSKKFTWENCAKKTLKAYKSLIK